MKTNNLCHTAINVFIMLVVICFHPAHAKSFGDVELLRLTRDDAAGGSVKKISYEGYGEYRVLFAMPDGEEKNLTFEMRDENSKLHRASKSRTTDQGGYLDMHGKFPKKSNYASYVICSVDGDSEKVLFEESVPEFKASLRKVSNDSFIFGLKNIHSKPITIVGVQKGDSEGDKIKLFELTENKYVLPDEVYKIDMLQGECSDSELEKNYEQSLSVQIVYKIEGEELGKTIVIELAFFCEKGMSVGNILYSITGMLGTKGTAAVAIGTGVTSLIVLNKMVRLIWGYFSGAPDEDGDGAGDLPKGGGGGPGDDDPGPGPKKPWKRWPFKWFAKMYFMLLDGEYALQVAIARGDIARVRNLLAVGADVNAEGIDRNTALHVAVKLNHLEILGILLANGANINAANEDGDAAVHLAAFHGNNAVVVILAVQLGAEGLLVRNGHRRTALHMAALGGDVKTVKTILANANPSILQMLDGLNNTALHLAAGEGHDEVVAILLGYEGVIVNALNTDGNGLLHMAAMGGLGAAFPALLAMVADPNAQNTDNNTPLHLAAEEGNEAAVGALLGDDRVTLNVVNRRGETPLRLALIEERETIIRLLLAKPGITVSKEDLELAIKIFGEDHEIVKKMRKILGIESADDYEGHHADEEDDDDGAHGDPDANDPDGILDGFVIVEADANVNSTEDGATQPQQQRQTGGVLQVAVMFGGAGSGDR